MMYKVCYKTFLKGINTFCHGYILIITTISTNSYLYDVIINLYVYKYFRKMQKHDFIRDKATLTD